MVLRIILIVLIVLVALVVVVPFALNLVGVRILQFGAIGGGEPTSGGTLIRSTDGGINWTSASVSEDSRTGFPATIIDFSFHPQNPDVIYLGTKSSGLWITENGGASWHRVLDARKNLLPSADVYKVALYKNDPNKMYLAVYQDNMGRVMKSDDGGKSFVEIYTVTTARIAVFDLWVDPSNANHLIMVTGEGGILETQNGGHAWRAQKWFSGGIRHLYINAAAPREYFLLTTNGKFFRSLDAGTHWSEASVNLAAGASTFDPQHPLGTNPFSGFGTFFKNGIDVLVADLLRPSTFYIGSKDGLFRTRDGGTTWSQLNLIIPSKLLAVDAVGVSPQNQKVIFAAIGNQLHKTEDGGNQWSISSLSPDQRIRLLLIHPFHPDTVFAILVR